MGIMSRFFDERGRFFGKVNVIDLLVLLVIVAVVILAAVRFRDASVETIPVRITLSLEKARQAVADALDIKGTVTDDGGTVLGQVDKVTVAPTREEFMTQADELKAFDSPIYSDISIEVLGEGVVSGSSVRVGNSPIRVGKRITVLGSGFEIQTTILGVVWGEEAIK
jgi:hypothetical protein